jgi:peptide/nickel transport system substrate-binding protein
MLRAITRTLVTYRSSADFATAIRLVPDLALEVPSRENGGISADGLTYTFHLRRGVRWDSNPAREVTTHDFVRAFKLLGNPVSAASLVGFYTDTIVGMDDYVSRFAQVPGTVPAIREFVNTQQIEGVRAADDFTLVFQLRNPAAHFLNVLALPCVAPVPVEYLNYRPDSAEFRQHTLSIGPYRITRYIQNREMLLERNPVWDPVTDPIRPSYVDRIHFRFGIDAQLQQLQTSTGTADLGYEPIQTGELGSRMELSSPTVWQSPGDGSWAFRYLDINHVATNGVTRQLRVRRAIALAADKAALVTLSGGPRVARVLRQAVPSSVSGYRKGADQYVTREDRGDPAEARALLAAAGYPNGISLRLAYINSRDKLLAQALQASLARAGITAALTPMTEADFFGRLLASTENAKRGEWDLALDGAQPPWFGENNGCSVIGPLFDGRRFGQNGWNCGGYSNVQVNALIDRATTAASLNIGEPAWSEAARLSMEEVAIIPLIEIKSPYSHSRRLRHRTWAVLAPTCDITSVWLADDASEKGRLR